MQKISFLFLLLVFACSEKQKVKSEKKIQKITFFQKVKQVDQINLAHKPVSGDFIEFIFNQSFNIDGYDSANSLFITIPAADSVFTFQNDSTHRFIHMVSTKACRDLCLDFITEQIDSAEIKGTKVNNTYWRIEAKTKYFNFVRNVNLVYNSYEKDEIILTK